MWMPNASTQIVTRSVHDSGVSPWSTLRIPRGQARHFLRAGHFRRGNLRRHLRARSLSHEGPTYLAVLHVPRTGRWSQILSLECLVLSTPVASLTRGADQRRAAHRQGERNYASGACRCGASDREAQSRCCEQLRKISTADPRAA